MKIFHRTILVQTFLLLVSGVAFAGTDPLPSWNKGAAKTTIMDFVKAVTASGSQSYIVPADRIAVFDNDGTLMSEQPIYYQFLFEAVKLKEFSSMHFDLMDPFSVKNAIRNLAVSDPFGELLTDTVTGIQKNDEEFNADVECFINQTIHPRFNRPFVDLVYQPMLELIKYLKDNGFKVYIVTATHSEFLRLWSEKTFGIPPENIIGSSLKATFDLRGNQGLIKRGPAVNMICNGADKPVAISYSIGKKPIAAFGNSDGDIQMLQYATSGKGLSLGLIIHHTDPEREWAYDNPSDIGQLKEGMEEAVKRGWIIVNMKNDWKVIYPFEKSDK